MGLERYTEKVLCRLAGVNLFPGYDWNGANGPAVRTRCKRKSSDVSDNEEKWPTFRRLLTSLCSIASSKRLKGLIRFRAML